MFLFLSLLGWEHILLTGDYRMRKPMVRAETRVITAHVPLLLAEKVDQLATRHDRSRGWIVRQALASWIGMEEERNRLTREALADVDGGGVMDHLAVQAWTDSLSTIQPVPVPRKYKRGGPAKGR